MPVILALGRGRQEEQEFNLVISSRARSRPACSI